MTDLVLLLPCDPLNERDVDEAFQRDRNAARAIDIPTSLIDHDRLTGSDRTVALRGSLEPGMRVVYRGWMMTTHSYGVLTDALSARGLVPVTSAPQYESAHYLRGWIDVFAGLTPSSAFVPVDATDREIMAAGRDVGGDSFIVKDWVKSRKHEWDTACYAPSVDALPSIVAEFIRLQEESLVGGIVIRRFVDLDKAEPEIRIWWAHNEIALVGPHPDFSGRPIASLEPEFLKRVQDAVTELGSPFVTTDVARTGAGEWIVIEVGDGQVSGWPDSATDDEIAQVLRAVSGA